MQGENPLVVTQDVAALLLGDAGSSGLHCIPASLSCQADEQKDYTKLVSSLSKVQARHWRVPSCLSALRLDTPGESAGNTRCCCMPVP